MIQKLTASILLLLMAATTAMSQQGLSYCLHQEELFVGKCACSQSAPSNADSTCDGHSCCHDTGHQSESGVHATTNDCNVSLFFNLAEFSNLHEDQVREMSHPTPVFVSSTEVIPTRFLFATSSHDTRGPPPPLVTAPEVPLFLRHSVFLV